MPDAPTRKRDRTRAHLLDCALVLFADAGYETTTIDDIAARAGVARQTVLNHFPRKEEFVREWGARRRDRVAAQVSSVVPDGDVRQRLFAVYDALAGINTAERAVTAALHLPYLAITAARPVPDVVVDDLRAGQRAGEVAADLDAVAAAQVLTAIYFDTLSRWLLTEIGPLDVALRLRLSIVLDGIAPAQ